MSKFRNKKNLHIYHLCKHYSKMFADTCAGAVVLQYILRSVCSKHRIEMFDLLERDRWI